MKQALLESTIGRFMDGTPVDSVPRTDRRTRSVMDHLHRLFNTREGCLPHLAGYGLPDISEVYRSMPGGVEMLRDAIRTTVEKYEPRLRNVRVNRLAGAGRSMKIVFILSGELAGAGPVRFQTTFTSTGNSEIAQWKRPE